MQKRKVGPYEKAGEGVSVLAQGHVFSFQVPTRSSSINQASLGAITISLQVNTFFLKLRELWSLEHIHQRTYCFSNTIPLVIGSYVNLHFRKQLSCEAVYQTIERNWKYCLKDISKFLWRVQTIIKGEKNARAMWNSNLKTLVYTTLNCIFYYHSLDRQWWGTYLQLTKVYLGNVKWLVMFRSLLRFFLSLIVVALVAVVFLLWDVLYMNKTEN